MQDVPLTYPKPSSTRPYSRIRNNSIDETQGYIDNAPLFIGVGGGSSSGKKKMCKMIMDNLLKKKVQGQVVIIRLHTFCLSLMSGTTEICYLN